MEKPTVEKLRNLTNGFELYTFNTSVQYANECRDLEDLAMSIRDNLIVAQEQWDSEQDLDYDDDNNLILSTITGNHPDCGSPLYSPFLKILVPDDWK